MNHWNPYSRKVADGAATCMIYSLDYAGAVGWQHLASQLPGEITCRLASDFVSFTRDTPVIQT